MSFAPGDPAALAAAVHRLLADPALGRRLVAAARAALAAEHGWARVAERTVTTYERAVGQERVLRRPRRRGAAGRPGREPADRRGTG